MKTCKLLLLALCCGCVSASAAGKAGSEAPRIVNIVNFIRNIEPRSEEITETVLYETVARRHSSPNTGSRPRSCCNTTR